MSEQQTIRHSGGMLPALTGLRALAAFMVLSLHAGQNFPNWLTGDGLSNRGYLGVDLFFILSGFIIAHVYIYDLVPLRALSLRVFLWHRFIRLFPTHATVLIVLIGLIVLVRLTGIVLKEQQSWDYRDLPWHFLMVHAWGTTKIAGWNAPSWSISAEWFAYLLFPIIAAAALALPRRVALPLWPVPLLAAAVVFELHEWNISTAWIGIPALLRVSSEFCCGVLLYRALRIDIAVLPSIMSDILSFGALTVFFVAVVLAANDFVLIALLATLIAGVSWQGTAVRAVFGCRPAVWLGEISYSTYLVHFPVLLVLRHGVDHISHFQPMDSEIVRMLLFVIGIAMVIGIAAVSYYLVEYPARKRWRNAFGTIEPRPPQMLTLKGLRQAE